MKLVGADVYVWSEKIPDVPKKIGTLSLNMISNSGTRLYPPPAPEIDVTDWFQCRYLSDTEITHQDVEVLLKTVDEGFVWTKVQKLYQKDGINAFSQPY